MTPADYVRQRELVDFVASFAVEAEELAQAAEDAGRADVALLAADAAAAVYSLLDLIVRAPLRVVVD